MPVGNDTQVSIVPYPEGTYGPPTHLASRLTPMVFWATTSTAVAALHDSPPSPALAVKLSAYPLPAGTLSIKNPTAWLPWKSSIAAWLKPPGPVSL